MVDLGTIAISLAGIISLIRLPYYLEYHNLIPVRSLKAVVDFYNRAKMHHLIFVMFDLRWTASKQLNILNYSMLILALFSLIVEL